MLVLVMSCLIPLFSCLFFFFSFRWDWRLTRGPTVYRLALEFFFFGLGTQGHGVGCSKIGFGADMARCIVHREIEETHLHV